MRKLISLLIILLAVTSPAAAQQRCRDAAHAAAPLLEDAKVHIELGATNEAIILIQAAQVLLETCGVENSSEAAATPIASGETVEEAGPESAAPVMTSAVINPPDVNLEQSIAFIAF